MKRIFAHIDRASATLAEHPLFVRLRDSSVDPLERLRFVPCTAHFIMTFADLCHFVLPTNRARDRFDELSNMNLSEEADHWKWFLADLSTLGLDPTLRLTEALRLLWSDETRNTRLLSYRLCQLNSGSSSLETLVLVLSVEATGRVALESATPAGREAARVLGKKLVYFGAQHLDSEHGHTLSETDVRVELGALVLDDATLTNLRSRVDCVFSHFNAMLDESFRVASPLSTAPADR